MGNFLDKLLGMGENLVDGLEKGLPDDYERETDESRGSGGMPRDYREEKVIVNPRDLTVRIVGRIHHVVIDDRYLLCASDGKVPDPMLIGEKLNFSTIPEGHTAITMCPWCIKALLDLNATLLKRTR